MTDSEWSPAAAKYDSQGAGTVGGSGGTGRTTTLPAEVEQARDGTPPAETGSPATTRRAKPHGREEVVESIIDATLSLWSAKGPAELSLRSIAARAEVNYGLVHRHFGTKEALIRAAMNRVVGRSLGFVVESSDITGAINEILPPSTGAHARLLAWATLQYVLEDVLPEADPFLTRLLALAERTEGARSSAERHAVGMTVGSLIALLYGWRLFEPYLVRGLQLQGLDQSEIDDYIRTDMMKLVAVLVEPSLAPADADAVSGPAGEAAGASKAAPTKAAPKAAAPKGARSKAARSKAAPKAAPKAAASKAVPKAAKAAPPKAAPSRTGVARSDDGAEQPGL